MTRLRTRGAKSKRKISRGAREAIKRAAIKSAKRETAMRRASKAGNAALADDDPPEDPDEFRLAFARRIYSFLGTWRECDQRLCKRARACRGDAPFACARGQPPVAPAQRARTVVKIRRAIEGRMRESDAERARAPAATVPGERRVTR